MNYKMPVINFNSRILVEFGENIEEKNKELIKTYWLLNNYGKFKEDNSNYSNTEKAKKFSSVKFNNGIYQESLKEIESRIELLKEIDLFNEKLEKEFKINNEKSSNNETKLLNDVNTLFDLRKKFEKQSKDFLNKVAENESLLKKNFAEFHRIEFNSLYIIAKMPNKDKVVEVFTNKGFNWKSLNKLQKFGFLWMKRGFDKKIQEYIMSKTLKKRLVDSIEKEGKDVYELEINYL